VTWAKFGAEYADELANAQVSDAGFRLHTEGLMFLYRVEAPRMRIPKTVVRRFAGSPDYETAIKELLALGLWKDRGDAWEVVHSAEVVRQSLAAQRGKRDRDKAAQREHRKREKAARKDRGVSADVGAEVSGGVSGDTDSQTDSYPEVPTNGVKRPLPVVAQ
jgi:hypothetical protein